MTSEPSTITTVMNTAVSAKDQPEGAGLPESDDVKPKDEQPEYLGTKPKSEDYPSSSGGATKDRNPESAVDMGAGGGGYVHKLKKAWINAYSEANDAKPEAVKPVLANGDRDSGGGGGGLPSATASIAGMASNFTRGTPSPALSNKSSASSSYRYFWRCNFKYFLRPYL